VPLLSMYICYSLSSAVVINTAGFAMLICLINYEGVYVLMHKLHIEIENVSSLCILCLSNGCLYNFKVDDF